MIRGSEAVPDRPRSGVLDTSTFIDLDVVDAGEMAMIIDACHSAASVTADGFRPGPMGDPGLGQLSFDKGIRILAATQADSVAMESAQLHGGLLTFALTIFVDLTVAFLKALLKAPFTAPKGRS